MQEARFYSRFEGAKVKCGLCPHHCSLPPGHSGLCRVRKNVDGRLMTLAYGKVSGLHMDPIEKKPLYRFFPGSRILSLGSYGCNFRCPWCQNASISQCVPGDLPDRPAEDQEDDSLTEPSDIVAMARQQGSVGVAYTYNEPAVWFEYMMDVATMVRHDGMQNVVVSNGYINPGPLKELLEVADAFNIDLKSFDPEFYGRFTNGQLQPVLDTLKAIAREGRHLEVTFLVIPGLNDDPDQFEEMVSWIAEHPGRDTALHINRYFPAWNFSNPSTPIETLQAMQSIAGKYLNHIYLGNVGQRF